MTAQQEGGTRPTRRVPQWSPPLVGGMTRHSLFFFSVSDLAAMEPAAGGRDDLPLIDSAVPVYIVAAMEPAAGGRDDPGIITHCSGAYSNAAMEPAAGGRDDFSMLMSPVIRGLLAAMEPAAGGRDDQPKRLAVEQAIGPQWSPPLVGGMTPWPPPPPATPARRNGARRWWAG